jgi:hypothetical protein
VQAGSFQIEHDRYADPVTSTSERSVNDRPSKVNFGPSFGLDTSPTPRVESKA